jgi:hypothetical protein
MERRAVKSSFIGSKFGDEKAPRLVFLSLDPGNNEYVPDPADRRPAAVQRIHESEHGPTTQHWRYTHVFALRLFNEIGRFLSVRDALFAATDDKYALNGEESSRAVTPVLPYFCHVTSAKCGANGNKKMTQAPGGFFVKCREHAKQELLLPITGKERYRPTIPLHQMHLRTRHRIGRFNPQPACRFGAPICNKAMKIPVGSKQRSVCLTPLHYHTHRTDCQYPKAR